MNRALWSKAIGEARLLLVALAALMFGFHWLFVWITSTIRIDDYRMMLQLLPSFVEDLVAIPFSKLSRTGFIALAYIDPVVIFACVSWSIARGSDCVSGEIGRGTMELLLAQPIRRISVLATQALVTTAGAAVLALAAWLGTCAGVATVTLDQEVFARDFLPAAANLFAMTFFLAGASTLASSWDSYRWRTVGLVGGFYAVELVIKVVARLVPDYGGLVYSTFLGAFEPQRLVIDPRGAWATSLRYDGTLVGLGLAAYLLAAVIFCRRDLPAPL